MNAIWSLCKSNESFLQESKFGLRRIIQFYTQNFSLNSINLQFFKLIAPNYWEMYYYVVLWDINYLFRIFHCSYIEIILG